MKQWQATAPGKIILFGEHAVVYGRPAIAVPVSTVRAVAMLDASEPVSGFRIVAPDLDRDYGLHDAKVDDPLATAIQLTLNYLDQTEPPVATLTITSAIPLGRGLGSGAAISTAIVRVLCKFYEQTLPPADISKLVYEVEKLYHGTPSGIDNTVVAFEQPIYFIKNKPIERMKVARPFTVIIGDTGIVASTREVVGDLRRHWQAEPERYEAYFDDIGAITDRARAIIEQPDSDVLALGGLMNENQRLLETVGVSSPELETLVKAARDADALGAKLSGAGWGGNMIALVPPEANAIKKVAQALSDAGATQVIVTKIKEGS